jgi:hypothetical protein
MTKTYEEFLEFCGKRNIQCKINEKRYLEFREEYSGKFPFWKTVMDCVNWCYDNEKKMINSNRLRNWFKKVDIKQERVRLEPVWQPPT